jgi:hypothetical protein
VVFRWGWKQPQPIVRSDPQGCHKPSRPQAVKQGQSVSRKQGCYPWHKQREGVRRWQMAMIKKNAVSFNVWDWEKACMPIDALGRPAVQRAANGNDREECSHLLCLRLGESMHSYWWRKVHNRGLYSCIFSVVTR